MLPIWITPKFPKNKKYLNNNLILHYSSSNLKVRVELAIKIVNALRERKTKGLEEKNGGFTVLNLKEIGKMMNKLVL